MTAAPSTSPPSLPPRLQIESSVSHLLQSLLELGICASDVQDSALESSPQGQGVAQGLPGGLIGIKANQVVDRMKSLHDLNETVRDVMIPLEVVAAVDQGRNPHSFTKDFIERLSGENMYTNGILSAVTDYRDLLNEQMKDAFPDLAEMLQNQEESQTHQESTLSNGFNSNGSTRVGEGVMEMNRESHSVGGGENGYNGGEGGGLNGNSNGLNGSNGEVKMEE